MLHSLANWLLWVYFVAGAAGGIGFIVHLILGAHRRVEVHHRYYQTPVYYPPPYGGQAGDMAQSDPEPDRAA